MEIKIKSTKRKNLEIKMIFAFGIIFFLYSFYCISKNSDLLFALFALTTAIFCIKTAMLFKRENKKFIEHKKQYALEKANKIVDDYKNRPLKPWQDDNYNPDEWKDK